MDKRAVGDKDYPIGWPEIGKILLWGSMLGFGGRGAVGLGRMFKRRLKEREEAEDYEEAHKKQVAQTMTTPGVEALQPYQPEAKFAAVNIPDKKKEKEKPKEKPTWPLYAAGGAGVIGGVALSNILRHYLRKRAADEVPIEKQAEGLNPLIATVLGITAGAGGLYGGWHTADKLFDRERISSINEEIEQAKKEYEEALRAKTKLNLRVPKVAAFIDSMAESYEAGGIEKLAASNISFLDALPYAIYTVLAGAAANEAYKAYQASRSADPTVAKLKALENRPPSNRVMPIRATLAEPLDEEENKPVPSMI